MNTPSEKYVNTIEYIRGRLSSQYVKQWSYGIICGSGLGHITDAIQVKVEINYSDIPNFLLTTVEGHCGTLVFGTLNDSGVVIMKGRFHSYEGYKPQDIAYVIRILKILGVENIIITNVAGGLNSSYKIGDVVVIKDHICLPGLAGIHPLSGPNEKEFGPRFPAMSSAFNKKYQSLAVRILTELNVPHHSGVYIMVHGPTLESVAEARYLKMIGGDVVGMSTAMEVISAHHCGMKILTLSLVSNKVVDNYETDQHVSHEKVLRNSNDYLSEFVQVVSKILDEMIQENV